MRWFRTVITALLLMALLATLASAQTPRRLVTVEFTGWEQLQGLASRGLQILNYQDGVLAALASDEQVSRLRSEGGVVRLLDAEPDTDSYYLAYVPAGMGDEALDGLVHYPYQAGIEIVRASALDLERLPTLGIGLVKLPRAMKIPRGDRARQMVEQSRLGYSGSIQTMVDAVSSASLVGHVCKLQDDDQQAYCNALGTRYSYATAGLTEAADYIRGQLSGYGLTVSSDPFSFNGYPMVNVVAELPGTGPNSNHIVVLCAHFDSTSRTPFIAAPGADDNASGSAGVLEAARIFSQRTFDRTIRFVLFSGEEQGLIGSAHYASAAAARGDVIDGVINLDMIGYESVPPGDHIVEVHAGLDPASIALADALIANVAEYGVQLQVQKLTSGATNRSDHASFWNVGYPAVLGIEDFDDFNPYYHSTSDTLSNMQTLLMVEFTRVCVATVAELAGEWTTTLPTVSATQTCRPTATETYTPTATSSHTPTATATYTATATPTATPTTVVPTTALFLPLVRR
ncbi:MAG TPA: M20/M25/M40 family metallo-hydrolase [Anaerolineae bacterium]|nr:M20/M25/M40 family metallo-hydrolase [Anaerolineae bacterium]